MRQTSLVLTSMAAFGLVLGGCGGGSSGGATGAGGNLEMQVLWGSGGAQNCASSVPDNVRTIQIVFEPQDANDKGCCIELRRPDTNRSFPAVDFQPLPLGQAIVSLDAFTSEYGTQRNKDLCNTSLPPDQAFKCGEATGAPTPAPAIYCDSQQVTIEAGKAEEVTACLVESDTCPPPKPTNTPRGTLTPIIPLTPGATTTPTIPVTPGGTATPTIPVTPGGTATATIPVTPGGTETPTIPVTPGGTATPTIPVTPGGTATATIPVTPGGTATATIPVTPGGTATATIPVTPGGTATPTIPVTPGGTATATIPVTPGGTATATIPVTPGGTATATIPVTPGGTATATIPVTPGGTATPTIPVTPGGTATATIPVTPGGTATATIPVTPGATATPTEPTPSITQTPRFTETWTPTHAPTSTPSITSTQAPTATPTWTPTITPTSIAVYAYVANSGSDDVSVIDVTNPTSPIGGDVRIDLSHISTDPRMVAASPNLGRVFVTMYGVAGEAGSGTVVIIRTDSNTVAEPKPGETSPVPRSAGMLGVGTVPGVPDPADPDAYASSPVAYATNELSNAVFGISLCQPPLVAIAGPGLSKPQQLALTPSSLLYVSNAAGPTGGFVSRFTMPPVPAYTTYTAGIAPRGIAIVPNAGRVFVANLGSDDVSMIEGDVVKKVIPVGNVPQQVAIAPPSEDAIHYAFVTNGQDGTVSVIDADAPGPAGPRIPGPRVVSTTQRLVEGANVFGIVADPDEARPYLYVTYSTPPDGRGGIAILDARIAPTPGADPVVAIVPLDGARSPKGIAVAPQKPYVQPACPSGAPTPTPIR